MADDRTARALAATEGGSVLPDGTVVHGRTMLRGLRLLELLADEGPTTASSLAQASGIDKGTASRLLVSLRETGYAQQDPDTKRYWLGIKAVWLWQRYLRQSPLAGVAEPTLRRLVAGSGESATVDVLVEREVECLVSVESDNPLRVVREPGERMPVTASAPGSALLLGLDPDERGIVLQAVGDPADATVVEPGAADDDGCVWWSDGELAAISTPLPVAYGPTVASVTLWAPEVRLAARRKELVPAVAAAAREIASRLPG